MGSELVKPHHLDRRAVVYVRQSSPQQVLSNQESLRLQYALRQRARDLGWREADIEVVDAALGLRAASAAHRQGFKDLVARIALGEVGLIVSIEVTRLARNCSDWCPLLDICGHRGCLIADRDAVYDPGLPDGRLLLGLKGTISAVFCQRDRRRMHPPGHQDRIRSGRGAHAGVQVGEHGAGQHQGRDHRHLPRDQQQARAALLGRVRIPLQPTIRLGFDDPAPVLGPSADRAHALPAPETG